jgi:hypothetical protein
MDYYNDTIMSGEVLSSFISSTFSFLGVFLTVIGTIIVSFLTAYFTSKRVTRGIRNKFVQSLYEKRYQTYPPLLAIVHAIDPNDVNSVHTACSEIDQWQKTGGGYLLFSENTLVQYRELHSRVSASPKWGVKGYASEQQQNIRKASGKLCSALYNDLKLYRNAELGMEAHLYGWFKRRTTWGKKWFRK